MTREEVFRKAIIEFGVDAACEWFGYEKHHSFTKEVHELLHRVMTLAQLKEMSPGIFAQGEIIDGVDGVNMSDSGKMLRWVAVRGSIVDWAIYCHLIYRDPGWVLRHGNKVLSIYHIKKLVPCDDETLNTYRY